MSSEIRRPVLVPHARYRWDKLRQQRHLSPLHPVVERALLEPPHEAVTLEFRVFTHHS